MLRFFRQVSKRLESDRAFRRILEFSKNGQQADALKECTKLVEEYPYDVQIRHRLVMLQREMGEEIHLPNIMPEGNS